MPIIGISAQKTLFNHNKTCKAGSRSSRVPGCGNCRAKKFECFGITGKKRIKGIQPMFSSAFNYRKLKIIYKYKSITSQFCGRMIYVT